MPILLSPPHRLLLVDSKQGHNLGIATVLRPTSPRVLPKVLVIVVVVVVDMVVVGGVVGGGN